MTKPNRQQQCSGFSLAELLVGVVIGSVLVIGAGQLLANHIQTSARLEGLLRSQEKWSRIQRIIDQDIQEAHCIVTSGGSLVLKLPVSYSGSDGSLLNACGSSAITYTLSNTTLQRSGPAISAIDGSLDESNMTSNVTVATNVTEFSVDSVSSSLESSPTVSYTFNVLDPSGYSFKSSKTSSARARTRIID